MLDVICKKCGVGFESIRVDTVCPRCGSEDIIDISPKSDTEAAIDELAKTNSPLSLQVQEAEAHIAVGLAGVGRIVETIEAQRDHLREGAKEFIARGKCSDFSFEGFEKFLNNAIMIVQEPGRWRLTYPKFIQLDLSEVKNYQDGERKYLGYHHVVIFGELPKWLEHLYNKKENKNASKIEPDNPTGT